MSVAPNAGIVDLDTFLSPTGTEDGLQGQVPKPLAGQETHILSASGWVPGSSSSGTVTSVAATGGTGISVTGSPITTSGTLNITNTAPDQTVVLNNGTGISATGTYPNFTITNTAPDQTVVLNNGTGISVTGTYPNFTVTNTSPSSGGTVTSVSGTGTVSGLTLTGTVTGAGNLVLGGAITGFATSGANTDITSIALTSGTISSAPASSTDIVNKSYADSIATGNNFHAACQYATTADLGSVTYNNGTSGVGATITNAGTQVALAIDGHTFTATDVTNATRVLVKNESNAAYNGAYTVTNQGSGSTNWVLTRATDYDTSGSGTNEIDAGDLLLVLYGTTNANTSWVQQTPLPITVGTTGIVFVQFAAVQTYTAGTGLSLITNQFSITNVGTANTYGSASQVPVFTTNAQGQVTAVTNTAIAIGNSNLANSAITINGTSTSLGGSISVGTVTSVSALTLGTTGTDLSSTVANGSTTPVITLNVPTASATNRGVLSNTDWSTFNGKQAAYTNLTSIGSLVNGSGWLKNNGSGTFSYSTPTATDVGLGNVTNDAQTKAAVVPNTVPTNGQLLIGNGTNYTVATLTQGTDIAITNAAGSITIANTYTLAKSTSAFTTGAAATYTAPAGTEWVKITVVGPGGNGGAANNARATGGGGGAVAIKWLAMAPGQTLIYTVGTASGTASTVSSGTLTITTISAGSGTNGASTAYAVSITAGGAGGTATGGDVNITGGQGGYSYGSSTTVTTNFSGMGGDCPGFGVGGPALAMVATTGVQGNGYGAGAGGSHGNNTAAAGRGGIIIFEAY